MLIFLLSFQAVLATANPVYQLSISKLAEARDDLDLLLQTELIIDSELSLAGDTFVAELSPISARRLALPQGTKLIGKIQEIRGEASWSRDAKARIEINAIQLPDQQEIPAKATLMLEAQDQGLVHNSKKILTKSTELGASTLVGAMDALQYGGISTAILSHGISVGVGAALGLGLGLASIATSKGSSLSYDDSQLIKMRLDSDFELLAALPEVSNTQLEELSQNYRTKLDQISARLQAEQSLVLDLQKIHKYQSASYGEFIVLDLDITNISLEQIYLQDLVLSSNQHLKPLYSNPLITAQEFKAIAPGEKRRCRLAFVLGDYRKQDDYKLKLLDPLSDRVLLTYDLEQAH